MSKRYIVLHDDGVMELGAYGDTPKAGVLVHGDFATVFGSYASARRAIMRTQAYEKQKGYNWRTWTLRPVMLKERP